jgi:hypothetical protein
MKTLLNGLAGRRAFDFGAPITTAVLLLAALTARADTPYTGTGWVTGVPVLPVVCTNGAGQVLLRGNVQSLRVDGTDTRFPGRRLVFTDGAYQADGSALVYGTCYHELGTWDGTGTNFTATGGMWEINWRGVMRTDYSMELSLAGYGSGGTIDGLRMEETATRAAASAPIDPTVPLLYTGTIKPPPVNTTEIADNFDDNLFTGTLYGTGTVSESNQQLVARGSFAGVPSTSSTAAFVYGGINGTWSIPDGMTLEWRADLVHLDENATNAAAFGIGNGTATDLYSFNKGRDFAYLLKWSPIHGSSIFACEQVALRNTNVVLALALTWVNPNLVITTRVLDKADPNTVLYQHSVVDTPSADPTLTTAQFEALTGMRYLDLGPDHEGTPITSYHVAAAGVFQYTDGTQPAPTAIFDNLELRTSEIPLVGIERTVRLSWPASATINYAVEGAPTAQGPWLPVQEPVTPGMNQMTFPANALMQYFRLRQAP